MVHKFKIIYGGSLDSQTFNPILVDFFNPDSSIPSSFQKDNSRILFGEGDTPHFKKFINDFNVFTCLPSSMYAEKGEEWLEYNLKIKTKFPSLIIKMDMTNQDHVNKLGNLFEDSVSYCKVDYHGIGPDNDCIFKILKNNGEYDPSYFGMPMSLDNKRVNELLNESNISNPYKFRLIGTFDPNLSEQLYNKIIKFYNNNILFIADNIENFNQLLMINDLNYRLALLIALKYSLNNIDKYKLKPKFGKDDDQIFKFTFTWIKD
jgi:hypothetical protein